MIMLYDLSYHRNNTSIVTGDLNYRINDINTENVFKLIAECAKEEKYEKLLEKDELSLAIHDGKVIEYVIL